MIGAKRRTGTSILRQEQVGIFAVLLKRTNQLVEHKLVSGLTRRS